MKKLIINISGGMLQTIRSNFADLNIDEIEIFDEDNREYLNEVFEISNDPSLSKLQISNYWENVIEKEYPYEII